MSKASPIKVQSRDQVGTHATRKCRREGLLPGVVYGHKEKPTHVAVPAVEFIHMITHGVHLLELELPGKTETVIVKEIQYNYLGTDPVHVDFSRVDLNERVPVSVQLVLRGTPAGVAAGGVLQQILTELELECLVTDIPDQLKMNISKLEMDHPLHAGDIPLPEGAVLLTDSESVVAIISAVEEEEAAEALEAEATAEPEVIGRGKEKEEEGEEK